MADQTTKGPGEFETSAIDTEVLVVGGTAAGCCAAIAAARAGSHVVVLEPAQSIGGVI